MISTLPYDFISPVWETDNLSIPSSNSGNNNGINNGINNGNINNEVDFDETVPYIIQVSGKDLPGDGQVTCGMHPVVQSWEQIYNYTVV